MVAAVAKMLHRLAKTPKLEALSLGYSWFSDASDETLQDLRDAWKNLEQNCQPKMKLQKTLIKPAFVQICFQWKCSWFRYKFSYFCCWIFQQFLPTSRSSQDAVAVLPLKFIGLLGPQDPEFGSLESACGAVLAARTLEEVLVMDGWDHDGMALPTFLEASKFDIEQWGNIRNLEHLLIWYSTETYIYNMYLQYMFEGITHKYTNYINNNIYIWYQPFRRCREALCNCPNLKRLHMIGDVPDDFDLENFQRTLKAGWSPWSCRWITQNWSLNNQKHIIENLRSWIWGLKISFLSEKNSILKFRCLKANRQTN